MAALEEEFLRQLLIATRLLAASPAEQLRAFPRFVHKPDELANTFDECFAQVPAILGCELITPDAAAALGAIDRQLERMTDEGGSHWIDEAVLRAQAWSVARGLAATALRALGDAGRDLTVDWVTHVPGDPRRGERE